MTKPTYIVDFHRITEDSNSSSVVRRTASQILLSNGYLSLGKWLKGLGSNELLDLCDMAEVLANTSEESLSNDAKELTRALSEFVILSMMLTAAEGVVDLTEDVIGKHMKAIVFLCVAEDLYRKGLIELYHDKIDFTSNEKIAKLIDKN